MDATPPFLPLALSLIAHVALFLPLLAGLMGNSPGKLEKPPSPPVSVRLKAPPRTTPATPPSSAPHSTAAPSRRSTARPAATAPSSSPRRSRPTLTAPSRTARSAPSTPVRPSLGDGSYPTAGPRRSGRGFGDTGGPGLGRPGRPSEGQGSGQEPPGDVVEGARVQGFPRTVALSPSLQKADLPTFTVGLDCTIDENGRARVRVASTSGRAEFDQLLVQELQNSPWTPSTKNGRPIASTMRIFVRGRLHPGMQTITLTQGG